MHQPGIDVRPLREMTGHAMFNEVFLDRRPRARPTPSSASLNNGWAVANTTLTHERAGLGAGGGVGGVAMAMPGTIAGQLDRRAGDFAGARRGRRRRRSRRSRRAAKSVVGRSAAHRPGQGQRHSRRPDHPPGPRAAAHHGRARPLNNERLKAAKAAGGDIPGMANISKLR